MEPRTVHVGLGGNLGDRDATLRAALAMLDARRDVAVRKVSRFIDTEPVGPPGQGMYLNAAAELETTLSPRELLGVLHEIEAACGRDRTREQRWGPRSCDLDILLAGRTVLRTDELTLPHPRMHQRLFVLRPLAEIAPDAVHPVLGKTVAELLSALKGR